MANTGWMLRKDGECSKGGMKPLEFMLHTWESDWWTTNGGTWGWEKENPTSDMKTKCTLTGP